MNSWDRYNPLLIDVELCDYCKPIHFTCMWHLLTSCRDAECTERKKRAVDKHRNKFEPINQKQSERV